jgi:hypothetical protein
LMGLPKLVATAPGCSLSITVENWITPIRVSGRGVTLPWNKASITKGREGNGEAVAVGETAGVAVNTKFVGELVGLFRGTAVSLISGLGTGDAVPGTDRAGT